MKQIGHECGENPFGEGRLKQTGLECFELCEKQNDHCKAYAYSPSQAICATMEVSYPNCRNEKNIEEGKESYRDFVWCAKIRYLNAPPWFY